MHTLEPTVSYNYTPRVSQNDLPEFDAVDRIPYQNEITYGFTKRLLGKTGKDKVGYWTLRICEVKALSGL